MRLISEGAMLLLPRSNHPGTNLVRAQKRESASKVPLELYALGVQKTCSNLKQTGPFRATHSREPLEPGPGRDFVLRVVHRCLPQPFREGERGFRKSTGMAFVACYFRRLLAVANAIKFWPRAFGNGTLW